MFAEKGRETLGGAGALGGETVTQPRARNRWSTVWLRDGVLIPTGVDSTLRGRAQLQHCDRRVGRATVRRGVSAGVSPQLTHSRSELVAGWCGRGDRVHCAGTGIARLLRTHVYSFAAVWLVFASPVVLHSLGPQNILRHE